MRPLRYCINVTLDGCVDHRAGMPTEALHHHHAANLAAADGLVCGRVTYQMMEAAWREPARTGVVSDWMQPWMLPFARTIDAIPKFVASGTLGHVDWNAELLRGELREAIERLKRQPGRGLLLAGVRFALAVAELGLVDEFEFVVHPRLAGHGPTLLAGLARHVDLTPVGERQLGAGVVARRYLPVR